MNDDLFEVLEERVAHLLKEHHLLRQANGIMAEENRRLLADRAELKARLDLLIRKLEGIVE